MSRKAGAGAFGVTAVLGFGQPAHLNAQGSGPGTWQFELGGGVAIPISNGLRDATRTGVDFDLLIGYQAAQRLGVNAYGGLSLLKGEESTGGTPPAAFDLPDTDIWRYGIGLEINPTRPGNRFMALLGASVGLATSTVDSFTPPGEAEVPSSSSTDFSAGGQVRVLYRVNPNFGIGAGGELFFVFAGETESYLPFKAYLRWMQ